MPNILTPNDLTICYLDGTPSAAGYELKCLLNPEYNPVILPPKKTDSNTCDDKKVSDRFRNLGVPAGLLCTKSTICTTLLESENKGVIPNTLYDKLVNQVSVPLQSDTPSTSSARKTSLSKTRRRRKDKNKCTRKL